MGKAHRPPQNRPGANKPWGSKACLTRRIRSMSSSTPAPLLARDFTLTAHAAESCVLVFPATMRMTSLDGCLQTIQRRAFLRCRPAPESRVPHERATTWRRAGNSLSEYPTARHSSSAVNSGNVIRNSNTVGDAKRSHSKASRSIPPRLSSVDLSSGSQFCGIRIVRDLFQFPRNALHNRLRCLRTKRRRTTDPAPVPAERRFSHCAELQREWPRFPG